MTRFRSGIRGIVSVVVMGALAAPLFLASNPWPRVSRDYLEDRGSMETGALNLVSAIYLGYRAYDTLGETIVLLVAVAGTLGLIARPGLRIQNPEAVSRRRTSLLPVVTAKLGPVVLVFGWYLMMFGHVSPGGGFQGGVVLASGLVFLALGSEGDRIHGIMGRHSFERVEAAAFLLLMAASMAGIFSGAGFFGNPLGEGSGTHVSFIILLNTLIGFKVGAGIGLLSLVMLRREEL